MITHLKHRFNIFYVLVALLVLAAIPASPVHAIAPPDTGWGIKSYTVYRNYIAADDLLFVLEYDLKYASNPSEAPSDAFNAYITKPGTGIIASRNVDYYDYAFTALYFTSADATALGISWEHGSSTPTDYTDDLEITLEGKFPIPFSTVTAGVNSHTKTLKADNSSVWVDGTLTTTPILVGSKFLAIMEEAERQTGTSFITPTDKGKLLNTAGTDVVINILSVARVKSPGAFAYVSALPAIEEATFGRSGQTALENNTPTGLSNSLDTLGTTIFGSSGKGMLIGGIGFILVGISVLGMVFNVTQAVTPSMVLGIPLIMSGVILGVIPMAMAFLVFFFVLLLFGLTFLMSRLS